ncbi:MULTISPECIES: TetR/AcrR family transcriptional regulator [unclassified Microbacterium]|uniref:TetR/AcrR family transcriptional regulator n=1 Tax=unclassified Microbacterium TaxID=2609290 RepID=UPI000CFAD893|nr:MULTISPECIES: TetR family transcriptional regulator [unclassified Microbacterium]PRB11485.1 TetR family transcriptional regulator [Microbacterium sp. MYb72]
MFETEAPMSKSARTKARISAAAVESFTERGYAETTMRLIAEKAGVSAGNAYYYFPSKDHLVQELYRRVQEEHATAARAALSGEHGLVDRLRLVLESGLSTLTPYQRSAAGFLTAMIPPDSPINPLAAESEEARAITIGLFREAIDGAQHRLPADVAALLPEALFVGYLALVLRWTYDTSPSHEQTTRLLDAGLRLLSVALPFVRVPGLHRATMQLLTLIAEVRS